ncbi:MAG: DNA-directed RNA polymerase subunit omega [Bacteroidota bacterium]
MDYKKSKAETNTITRDLRVLEAKVNNIYEAVAIISKRSNQINSEIKEELTNKLDEFVLHTNPTEEVSENREQIEVSKYYEHLPKSHSIAIQEFLDDKTYFRNPTKESTNF